MKNLCLALAMLMTGSLFAQTKIDKTFTLKPGQSLKIKADYPAIRISTWDKNEISFKGTVMINGSESDDALSITSSNEGNNLVIKSEVKNLDRIPRRVTVEKDGQKLIFKNRAEWEKYADENGKGVQRMSDGVDVEIVLEILVPKNTPTVVEAIYGMVEVKGFSGPLIVDSTYGGVDASLTETSTGELVAETNYGHIYSNLSKKMSSDKDEDFHTLVSSKPGSGPSVRLESKYGNVYLRKQN